MLIRAIIEFDEEAQAFSATCPELNNRLDAALKNNQLAK